MTCAISCSVANSYLFRPCKASCLDEGAIASIEDQVNGNLCGPTLERHRYDGATPAGNVF